MDSQQAIIVGRAQVDAGEFVILGHEKNAGQGSNSNENTAHNAERTLQQKYFKEIAGYIQNVEEVHIAGTGTEQEQFMHFLANTPQFKNAVAKESTANKMSDEKLIEYIAEVFR